MHLVRPKYSKSLIEGKVRSVIEGEYISHKGTGNTQAWNLIERIPILIDAQTPRTIAYHNPRQSAGTMPVSGGTAGRDSCAARPLAVVANNATRTSNVEARLQD